MNTPPIVSPEEWKAARQKLLVKEKELTRARDALAAQRRRMPWMAVEKDYRFEGPHGPASLLDLFEGRRQLIVYRFFYGPEVTTYAEAGGAYPERACVGCSFVADQVAHPAHLNARDTRLAFVSRAPQAEIQGLKERMGWDVPWYTLTDDFDADFDVDEWHGTNAFIRDGDRIFRTYFIESRGDEAMGSTWSYLDITALGRRRSGRTRPGAIRRPRPISGGTTTTRTARTDDRPRRGRAGGGAPAAGAGGRCRRRVAAGARLGDAAPATPAGARDVTCIHERRHDERHGSTHVHAGQGALRRVLSRDRRPAAR